MSPYTKFIIAVLGVIAIALQQFFGIGDGETIFGMPADQIAAVIISLFAAFGVFAAKNAPPAGVAEVKVATLTAPAKAEVIQKAEATGAGLPDPPKV